jgi:hypothetical protein
METGTGQAVSMSKPRLLRHKMAVWAASVIVGGAGLAWAGHAAWVAYEHGGTPSCSWPLQVRGTATRAQAGLVRCYLRALAARDTAGLMAVADYDPAVRITTADLAHSTDARAGLATATFTPSEVDSTYVSLTISYDDGARESTGIINMIAMGGGSGWRIPIGTVINPGPSVPTAGSSPAP